MSPVLSLFSAIESGCAWPVQLLQGFVTCLDKGKGDGGVDSYRPVVNYPVLTRLWSSVRAKEALLSVSSHLPPGLHGGVPGRQAKTIWYQLGQLLEMAHFSDLPLHGIAVDIQRCFNNLPREPVWTLARHLGMPLTILKPWAHFLCGQVRRFRIRLSTGPAVQSNVGFPEGCAFSVFAMVLCDWMLTEWLRGGIQSPHNALTYIDDWHIIYLDANVFQMVWQSLTGFAQAMDLTLDLKKSFCWSSHTVTRRLLRDQPLSSVLSARDLGAHQNFSLRSGNRTVLDRLEALQELWPKMRRCLSPYSTKIRLLSQLAWPRALHGISVVHLGLTRYVGLRSGAMKGLRVNRVGANPFLHLLTHGVACDPEGWSTLQTLRDLREVGSHVQMQSLLDFHSRGMVLPPNGPCLVLVERLRRLGWTLEAGGFFCDIFGRCDIFHASWTELLLRVQESWPRVVAAEVSHRATLSGIQFADVAEARRILSQLGDSDATVFRCCLDGTLYQDLTKRKEQRGSDSVCVFCGQLDSVFHRNWLRPHFSECRKGCQFLDLIPSLAPCLSSHGWPLVPAPWYTFCKHLLAAPAPPGRFEWPSLPLGRVVHLFVDGSAAFPSEPRLRYASWGVSLALSAASLDHHILACGHVQGLIQTSYRAELQSMVVALRAASSLANEVIVWSDNSAVVRRARLALTGKVVRANGPHSDLWRQIEELVAQGRLGRVGIQKVTSHCEGAATSGIEQWVFWHNQLVDVAVGNFNAMRTESFWACWTEVRDAIHFGRQVHAEILGVMLRVARVAAERKPVPETIQVEQVGEPEPRPICKRQWVLDPVLGRRYRLENLQQIHSWWTMVGIRAVNSADSLQWVAGIQLFADFVLTTGWTGPVSPHFSTWYLGNGDVPDGVACHLGTRSTAFLRVIKAYWKANDFLVPAAVKRCYGYSIGYWTQCYRLPWPVRRLEVVDAALYNLRGRQLARPHELGAFSVLTFPEGRSWD